MPQGSDIDIGFRGRGKRKVPFLQGGPDHLSDLIGRELSRIEWWQLLTTMPVDPEILGNTQVVPSMLLGSSIDPITRSDMMDALVTVDEEGKDVQIKSRQLWSAGNGTWRVLVVIEGQTIVALAETTYNEVEAAAHARYDERSIAMAQMRESGQAYHEMHR